MDEIRSLEAQEALNTLFEISNILNTGLSKQALSTCVSLCENGANPEALAFSMLHQAVIKDLQGEVKQSNKPSS
ncbi:mitotic-spindle organizing gamma-tubulin ring associated-domain-containing protein [Umbelopsis sp. AD052]|nr:mitotic-spindle organizing gamma-tubulin ring associated-domain-containing protein [Umbelopsis sp. AD052]